MSGRAGCAVVAVAMIAAAGAPARAEHPPKPRVVGLLLDAGVPDGVGGGLVYRPRWFVRAHVAGGYNFIGPGMRAGVSLVAWPTWLAPSITLEAGYAFPGDAGPLVAKLGGGEEAASLPALDRVGYRFASAHAGLELGRERATFFLHAGITSLVTRIDSVGESADMVVDLGEDEPTVEIHDSLRVRVRAISARTGVIVYF